MINDVDHTIGTSVICTYDTSRIVVHQNIFTCNTTQTSHREVVAGEKSGDMLTSVVKCGRQNTTTVHVVFEKSLQISGITIQLAHESCIGWRKNGERAVPRHDIGVFEHQL